MSKRLLAVLLALFMVVGCLPAATATAEDLEFSDMPDNWSTKALESAVANGLFIGDNGKIMPRDPLTRAQMATVIVRAFGATEEGDISSYTDVKSSDWFASSIAKAYKMGVMEGYAGRMNPDGNITREQVFAVLARALKLGSASKIDKTFEDIDNISDWAKGEVYALVNAGYIHGSNGSLNPQADIRRDEFAQVMYNIIKQYIGGEGEYTEAAEGNVIVNVPGVKLKDLTIDGDLIIGDGVGDGDVVLKNVTIDGRLVLRGGGDNSIILCGTSSVPYVIATKADGAVRVKVEGDAEVEVIYVDDESDDIIIEGSVGTLEVAADDVTVKASKAKIDSANISGNNSTFEVDSSSKVESVKVSAKDARIDVEGSVSSVITSGANTSVIGKGSVKKVEAKHGADGTKIETPSTEISVSEGVLGVTAGDGTEVEGGTTITNDRTGSGVDKPSTGGGGIVVPPVKKDNANFEPTGDVGIAPKSAGEAAGKIYAEYELTAGKDNNKENISLAKSNIGENGYIKEKVGDGKWETLDPNTDSTLWFNVESDEGKRYYEVKTNDGNVYTATLNWTAPTEINATKSGEPAYNEERKETYQLYTVDVDVTPDDSKVYQIKPDGTISELPILADDDNHLNIWFRLSGGIGPQQDGDHVFLIKKGETWNEALIKYNAAEDPMVEEALKAVNNASNKSNYKEVKTTLENNATKLGLDLEEYNELDPEGRKNAVANDIYNNKPAGGYSIEGLREMFNEIVETRMVFQESVKIFSEGSKEQPLEDIKYITMLIDNLKAVEHQKKHSGKVIAGENGLLETLKDLKADFNALSSEQQTDVLDTIDYTKNASSTQTRNALRDAIDLVKKTTEDDQQAEQKIA